MTNRSKPSSAGRFCLQKMRTRRDRRRSRTRQAPLETEQLDFQSATSSETTQPPSDSHRRPATGNYLSDMLSEREAILNRIEFLQLELVKERKDLTAIDIVLSRVVPINVGKPRTPATSRKPTAFVDVDFEVITHDPD